jgi:hypothetical protein
MKDAFRAAWLKVELIDQDKRIPRGDDDRAAISMLNHHVFNVEQIEWLPETPISTSIVPLGEFYRSIRIDELEPLTASPRSSRGGRISRDLRKHQPNISLHLVDRPRVARQMFEQTLLKQPIDHRIDHRGRHGLRLAG